MARIVTSGGEIGIETDGFAGYGPDGVGSAISGGTFPSLQSSVVYSGQKAWKFDTGASATGESFCEWKHPQSGTPTTNRWYYLRARVYFPDVIPTTEFNLMTGENSAIGSVIAIRLKTDGTLTLSRRVNTAANIGTPTAVLTPNTWYRVDLAWNIATGGGANSQAEMRLNGTVISTVTGLNLNSTALNRFEIGCTTTPGETNYVIYCDDVALNDDQGASENSYPSDSKVVYLGISSIVQAGSWTGGAGGAVATTALDAPPAGTASETDSTQIESVDTTGDNATDELRVNLATYSSAGIGSEDVIKLIQTVLWHGTDASVSGVNGSYGGFSNPSWSYDTFQFGNNLATALGTWDVNWSCKLSTPQYAPSVTLGNPLVLALRKTDAGANVASVCFIGAYVEFVDNAATSQPPLRPISSGWRW